MNDTLASEGIKQVTLARTIQAEDSDFFTKGSVVDILTPPDAEGIVEIQAVQAFDLEGNPYENDNHVYSMKLAAGDFYEMKTSERKKRAIFKMASPGSDTPEDAELDSYIHWAMNEETWNKKGLSIDPNGWVMDDKGTVRGRAIEPETLKTDADVIAWVVESKKNRLNDDMIRRISGMFFDDNWIKLADLEIKRVNGERLDTEDHSIKDPSSKDLGEGKMPKFPDKENTKEKTYDHQGKISIKVSDKVKLSNGKLGTVTRINKSIAAIKLSDGKPTIQRIATLKKVSDNKPETSFKEPSKSDLGEGKMPKYPNKENTKEQTWPHQGKISLRDIESKLSNIYKTLGIRKAS